MKTNPIAVILVGNLVASTISDYVKLFATRNGELEMETMMTGTYSSGDIRFQFAVAGRNSPVFEINGLEPTPDDLTMIDRDGKRISVKQAIIRTLSAPEWILWATKAAQSVQADNPKPSMPKPPSAGLELAN